MSDAKKKKNLFFGVSTGRKQNKIDLFNSEKRNFYRLPRNILTQTSKVVEKEVDSNPIKGSSI